MSVSSIEDKYGSLGGPTGLLGSALDSENSCPDGIGRYRTFTHGSIHWHPHCGAHATRGPIRDKWAQSGWEKGPLGYPISDETDLTGQDLLDMLPEDYLQWTYPGFEVGAWLNRELFHRPREKLGRWSKFEHGCITWWQTIQPPRETETWLWQTVGLHYVPKLGDSLPDQTLAKITEKPPLPDRQDQVNSQLTRRVMELYEKVTVISGHSTQSAESLAQTESRLLSEIMDLSDTVEQLKTGFLQTEHGFAELRQGVVGLRGELAALQTRTAQAEQELSKVLLSTVLDDARFQAKARRNNLISYTALALGIIAIVLACMRYF